MREFFILLKARFILKMKYYFRYPLNIIFPLVDPIIWLSPMYFMGKAFEVNGKISGFTAYTGNSDYMGFLIIGFMASTFVSTALWATGFTLKTEMMQGTLEANWSAPIDKMAFLIGTALFQFCEALFEIILTMIICHFLFGFTITINLFRILLYLIPGIIAIMGIGIGVAALVLLMKDANTVIDLSNILVMGLSGSNFPVKILPKGMFFISILIPLTYLNDSLRAIMINQEPFIDLKYQLLILFASMFVFYILGRGIFMRVERKCREKGMLSGH